LPPGARVLDVGCREGSFRAEAYEFQTVRADLNVPPAVSVAFVQADAVQLPFPSRTFDAVILNHCLEHFVRLKPALQEIGRVVKRGGAAFVAVPDARTLTDRIYRKVFKNAGGHCNLFGSSAELEKMLAWYLGLPHVATRTLHSGLTFLNGRNLAQGPYLRSEAKFRGIWEPALARLNASLRLLDRRFGTRLSVYGWALYFGTVPEAVDPRPMVNVCVRCGQGLPFVEIRDRARAKPGVLVQRYVCPACGAANLGLRD
jgi:SAM-dependent methyltransferase